MAVLWMTFTVLSLLPYVVRGDLLPPLFLIGDCTRVQLKGMVVPADRSNMLPLSWSLFPYHRYALSGYASFKALLRRDWTLMQRNSFIYIFKTMQVIRQACP